MPEIEDDTRQQIAQFLPIALKTALKSYQDFCDLKPSDDAKEFKARHDACKVAVAHIQLLIKLAGWADLPPDQVEGLEEDKQEQLRRMIENASGEVKTYLGE
ncbi:MAG: hypothetical protein ACLFP8_08415 [Alphaproteobacteria bacterium]